MRSRMDRYKTITDDTNEVNRLNKNQELYKNLGKNARYTSFSDVNRSNEYFIDNSKNRSGMTRESYQNMKEYVNIEQKPRVKKELEDFNHLYQNYENRAYDINSVLEKARQNRKDRDSLEEKRKLKNTNYNILASLNPEELEKYRKEKKARLRPEENELRGLIDTIASKTLAGEISKEASVDLLSDLMATNALDMVASAVNTKIEEEEEKKEKDEKLELSREILDKNEIKTLEKAKEEIVIKPDNDIMKDLDKSFYTKSMDLSDKDFFLDDEETEKKIPGIVKFLLVLILIGLIGVTIYFIYQSI